MPHFFRSLSLILVGGALPLFAEPETEKPKPKITLHVVADYLALHVSGKSPHDATALEYRLQTHGRSGSAEAWLKAPAPAEDGTFKFDVPLPEWRWSKFEMRSLAEDKIQTTQETMPKLRSFTMLSPERLAALENETRAAWERYMKNSAKQAEQERDFMAAECRNLGLAESKAAPHGSSEFKLGSDVLPAWYGSKEAHHLATAIVSYQTPSGGWSKAVDYSSGPRSPGTHWTNNPENPWHYCGTLDNRSTTEQIKFLAHIGSLSERAELKASGLRGIEWILNAQFPNGGWPQVYPVEPGYHEAITLNDGAMLHALEVLLSVSKGDAPFVFVDESIRQRAKEAFDKGIDCLLKSQVKLDGKPTVWCAQHDPISLEPVAARLKEPPSLSGAESAEMLKFLMQKGPINPTTTAAIEGGIAWLSAHRITNLRSVKDAAGKTDYVVDESSKEIYWARFYDVQTGLPIFAGAQDGIVYHSFHEMAQHNKVAYDYFTTRPDEIIGKGYERWKKRLQKKTK